MLLGAQFFLFTHHSLETAGVMVGVLGIWFKYVWPWLKPKIRGWQDRRVLMHGRRAVDGVTEEVAPLSRRMKRVEKRLDDVQVAQTAQVEVTNRLDAGQVAIIERMDGHDVRVAAIDSKVDTIQAGQGRVLEMLSHLFENGRNSNNPGDLAARNAIANGTYLPNPELPTFTPMKDATHDRREDD